MSSMKRINQILYDRYGGRIAARENDGCVVLEGELDRWDDIVQAGLLAAKCSRSEGLINDIRFTGGEIPPMRVPPISDSALEGASPDILIVGGGIVGCAIARECAKYDMSILLCEKEHDVALHASSRNDGMIHPGIDLIPGQVKRRYNMRGNRMYDEVCKELDVPFRRSGQYLCFLKKLYAAGGFIAQLYFLLFGPVGRYIGKRAFRRREPHMNTEIHGALFFPSAGVVSPYGLTIAYAENAVDNGVRLSLDTAVLGMRVENGEIKSVSTNRGTIYPKVVVNAAGVFSEDVATMACDRFFSIHPRRGTNTILDSKSAVRLNTIVSSLGTSSTKKKHTKGGGLIRTIDGNILVGPDAVETCEKENFETTEKSVTDVFDKQRRSDPALRFNEAITYFTGVRAATYEEDFVIRKGRRTRNIVHAAGIQSPGITAAPAIAVDVAKMAAQLLGLTRKVAKNPNFNPIRKGIVRVNELLYEERNELIRQNPDYGEIVCRCEEISRGEVLDALHRSVPCDTVDGVKRRARPGMGRCQGGFCGPLVLRIIAEDKGLPLEEVEKSGIGSELLFGGIKEVKQND
ncbi:MAG TPA: NAD(P)/FAD-dependent oxidoreductase [Feifaniaceae bacterium]|nr:NAD(P)/FAD-dependent oxidoreductase [Feifaniaceae bacterium]